MDLISWRPEYQVGVAQIDAEHKYLFELINKFHHEHVGGKTLMNSLPVLNRLVAYAEEHFRHEEDLMQEICYPRLARQMESHQKLYASIFDLTEKLSKTDATVNADTMRFLKFWLVEHILKEDMDIGDFMRRKSAQSEKTPEEETGDAAEKTVTPKPAGEAPKQD